MSQQTFANFTALRRNRGFGADFRWVSHFEAHKILTVLCRANSTDIPKDLRKVLLGLEA